MRYVVLLVLLAVGSGLLYLARYRYQAVNQQLARLNSVEGVVDSVASNGDLNLKYTVARYSSLPAVTSLDRPIELHNTRSEFYISLAMAAGAFLAGYLLYRNPDFLWTRFIGYPVAVVAALFGAGMVFAAFQNQSLL